MAHGNGAAIDVHQVRVHLKRLHKAQHDRGKGLIDFKEVDIPDFHPMIFQDFLGHGHGASQHDCGVCADLGCGFDTRPRCKAVGLSKLFRADQNTSRPIYDTRAVTRMVDMIDLFQMRIFQKRHVIKTRHHLTHRLEAGIQRAQRLHVCARAHVFVPIKDREAVHIFHRHDAILKAVVSPSLGRAFLAFNGQRIGVIA